MDGAGCLGSMQVAALSPRLIRIARRFNVYLLLGLLIVISAIGLGAWETSALQTIHDLEVAGQTGAAAYAQAVRVENLLRIVTPTWNFLGLGLLTFGIGMSIVVIIFNLRGAEGEAMAAYLQAFPDREVPPPRQPGYAGAFPTLLFMGLAAVIANFLFALSGGLAAAGFISVNFAGFSAASWAGFVEVLRTPQRPGSFSFIILGIGLSLATIVYDLRLQARRLPHLIGPLATGVPTELEESLIPRLPRLPFALLGVGFITTLVASYPIGLLGGLARADLLASGGTNAAAARTLAWTTSLFPVLAVTGIVILLAGIVYWLLLIIQGLRDQRQLIHRMGLTLAGAEAASVEQPVWPERVAGYLAGGGLLTLLLLFLPASLRAFLSWEVIALQGTDGAALVDLIFLRDLLTKLVPDLRFIGMALAFLGIGLTLGVIIINLRGIGAILLPTLTAIIRAKGQAVTPSPSPVAEGDVATRAKDAMSRFGKRLFLPILVGALIMISTTFPLVLPLHANLQLEHRDALLAGDQAAADAVQTRIDVLSALREPWNFIGMGLIFFGIGRYFGTIIGFVQARRVVISDACGSLAAIEG